MECYQALSQTATQGRGVWGDEASLPALVELTVGQEWALEALSRGLNPGRLLAGPQVLRPEDTRA